MAELTIEEYSEKSFVVRGNTKAHKDELAKLNGKYNGNLKNGAGWIFSKRHEKVLKTFVESVCEKNPKNDTENTSEKLLELLSTYSVEQLNDLQKNISDLILKKSEPSTENMTENIIGNAISWLLCENKQ